MEAQFLKGLTGKASGEEEVPAGGIMTKVAQGLEQLKAMAEEEEDKEKDKEAKKKPPVKEKDEKKEKGKDEEEMEEKTASSPLDSIELKLFGKMAEKAPDEPGIMDGIRARLGLGEETTKEAGSDEEEISAEESSWKSKVMAAYAQE